jgi:hypothetical protein
MGFCTAPMLSIYSSSSEALNVGNNWGRKQRDPSLSPPRKIFPIPLLSFIDFVSYPVAKDSQTDSPSKRSNPTEDEVDSSILFYARVLSSLPLKKSSPIFRYTLPRPPPKHSSKSFRHPRHHFLEYLGSSRDSNIRSSTSS